MGIEYLNNKKFEEVIATFKKAKHSRKKKPEAYRIAENELVEAFYILAGNIIRAFHFQLIDDDDMLQEGVMICFEKIDCFDPNYVSASGIRSKGFNYFTTCILNHFRQQYRTAKMYKQLKERFYDFLTKNNTDFLVNLAAEKLGYHDED